MNNYIKEFLLARSPLSDIKNTYIQALPNELYLELIKIYIYDRSHNCVSSLLNTDRANKTLSITYMKDKLMFSQHEINADYDMRKEFIKSIINGQYMYIVITNCIFAETIDNMFLVNFYQDDDITGLIRQHMMNIPMTYELFCALLVMLL